MKTTIKKLRRLGIVSQLEDKTMKIERRRFTEFAAVALIIMATILFAVGQAQWDLNPGGVAFAKTVAAPAFASSEMETYQLHLEVPQVSQAANGDVVSITGAGVFSIHPKTVSANGKFTHSDSQGNVLGSGTWVATELLSFQPYGCGVVLGFPIPANLCGGKLILRVQLTSGSGQFEGVLSVFCIAGPNPPNSHDDFSEEGARLDIIGVNNFNKIVSGGNVYVKTS